MALNLRTHTKMVRMRFMKRFYLFLSLLLHTGIFGWGALFLRGKEASHLQFPVVQPQPFKEPVEVQVFTQNFKGSESSKNLKSLSLKRKGQGFFSEKQNPKATTNPHPPTPLKSKNKSKNNSHSKNKRTFSPQQALTKSFDKTIVQNALPVYPPLALKHGWAGNVLLRIFVSPNGKVKEVRVLEGSEHSVLNQSAIRAARQWVFKPSDYPYQLQKKIVFKINFL